MRNTAEKKNPIQLNALHARSRRSPSDWHKRNTRGEKCRDKINHYMKTNHTHTLHTFESFKAKGKCINFIAIQWFDAGACNNCTAVAAASMASTPSANINRNRLLNEYRKRKNETNDSHNDKSK